MKASIYNYGKPTPAALKRIGDAILILGTYFICRIHRK